MGNQTWLWVIIFSFLIQLSACRRQRNDQSGLGFNNEPISQMVAYTEEKATFKCIASTSKATIEWLLDGQSIDSSDQRFIIEKNKLTVRLGIKVRDESSKHQHHYNSPTTDHVWPKPMSSRSFSSGMFQCKASLGNQVIISEPAKLIVAVLDDFDQQPDKLINVYEGNTAVIPCKPPNSMPPAIMEYLFNDILITKSEGRYLLMKSGNLQILDAQISDTGRYRCVAHNPFIREKRNASWIVQLNVKPRPGNNNADGSFFAVHAGESVDSAKNVKFVIKPENHTKAVMGTNVTLECVAEGSKPPRITWYKHDGSLGRHKFQQDAGNLILITVGENDAGAYICEATVDDETIKATSFVEVQMTPRLTKTLKNTIVNEGEKLSLECVTKGNPKPRINWFLNGKSLNNHSDDDGRWNHGDRRIFYSNSLSLGISFLNDFSKLIVSQSDPSRHSGIYQCFASNELGCIYSMAQVKVLLPGEADSLKPGDQSILGNPEDLINPGDDEKKPNVNRESFVNDDQENAPSSVFIVPPRGGGQGRKRNNRPKLIPPSKPKVKGLSDTSVMVNWEIPAKNGLPVSFFKVQYKEVGKNRGDWNTLHDDIPPHITSHVIDGLKLGSKYKFRVVAAYSNNDNREGQSSEKFHLIKTNVVKSPKPAILGVVPRNESSIEITWDYPSTGIIPVDGFYIHYRASSSAGEYFKITVNGANKRSHVVTHLLPATSYEFKIRSFFPQSGTSEFSEILTATTLPDPDETLDNNGDIDNKINVYNGLDKKVSKSDYNNIYLIAFGIGGFALIVFIICSILQCIRCKQSSPKRKQISKQNQSRGGDLVNGSLLHQTSHHSPEDYKSEPDTLSQDKSSVQNNVHRQENIVIDNYHPMFHGDVKSEKGFQTRTYVIDAFCEDTTFASRSESWARRSRNRKNFEHEAGVKLIATASHNSLHRKYLYDNGHHHESRSLERRKQQGFKSEEHLKCSLNARIQSKSSSFTKLDGTLERKKKRNNMAPQVPERLDASSYQRSLSSSRLNGSLEKRKRSRNESNHTLKSGVGKVSSSTSSSENKMNSCNAGTISHINSKPPLLIMQSSC